MTAKASPNGLALAGKVTETSLALPKDLEFEDWENTGKVLGQVSRACQWWIGDWLNFGERAYGDKYSQAMEVTGLDYSTLTNYAWVAKEVESSRRRETLSWSHHAEVAALEPVEQKVLLQEAADGEWTRAKLRSEIKETAEVEPDLCPHCKRAMPKGKA